MMRNKRSIFIILILFTLVTGTACRLSLPNFLRRVNLPEVDLPVDFLPEDNQAPIEPAPDNQAPDEQNAPVDPGSYQPPVLWGEPTWYQEDDVAYVVFSVQNPNSQVAFEYVEMTVYLYDANGQEVDYQPVYIPLLFPNETIGHFTSLYLADDAAPVASVEISQPEGEPVTDLIVNQPFTIDKLLFFENNDFPQVSGVVTNTSSSTWKNMQVNIVCHDSAGNVVGGGYTLVQFVPANSSMGFISLVETWGEVASVEAYPTFAFMVEAIEDETVWSDISIQQSYFFEDEVGFLYGGYVIQNNTDMTLRDSVGYVTFYDAEGNVTSISSETIDFIYPNQSLGVAPWVFAAPEGAVTSDYDLVILPGEPEEDFEINQNIFTVQSTELIEDFGARVFVEFTNDYTRKVSDLDINVLLFDASGSIVGSGSTWYSDPIAPGASAKAEVWASYDESRTVKSISVWIMPNTFTEFE